MSKMSKSPKAEDSSVAFENAEQPQQASGERWESALPVLSHWDNKKTKITAEKFNCLSDKKMRVNLDFCHRH